MQEQTKKSFLFSSLFPERAKTVILTNNYTHLWGEKFLDRHESNTIPRRLWQNRGNLVAMLYKLVFKYKFKNL